MKSEFSYRKGRICCNLGIQYIPRHMHPVFALLCFVVVIHWLISPYPSGLLHWHCGNLTIAPVPAKQPWWIWINTPCEFIMNDCITKTKQSTTSVLRSFSIPIEQLGCVWIMNQIANTLGPLSCSSLNVQILHQANDFLKPILVASILNDLCPKYHLPRCQLTMIKEYLIFVCCIDWNRYMNLNAKRFRSWNVVSNHSPVFSRNAFRHMQRWPAH